MIFEGLCTALVTPFDKEGKIDFISAKKLIQFQLRNRIDALLILGSTGESFAISEGERREFIPFVKSLLPRSCKLIVGAGTNDPVQTIRLINDAQTLGADCCLVTPPYFVKCTQNGIIDFFKTVCDGTKLPIIVYNIPSRSGVNMLPETMQKISEIDSIAGLKEANGDINHILEMFAQLKGKLPIYCGNDNLNQVFLSLGASGIISVSSNVFPKEIGLMWKNRGESLKIHEKFFNFNNLMFCEPNPIPVKYALSSKKLIRNVLRPPLTKLEKKHAKLIDEEMKKLEGK